MRAYQFTVGRAEAGWRVDRYLARHLPNSMSRSVIQQGIRAGNVTVDSRTVKSNHRLRFGEMVSAQCDLPARSGDAILTPQAIPLEVVYEDDALLLVNKPAGLVTHPAPGHWDGTLVNAILWHLRQADNTRKFRIADFGLRNEGQTQSAIHNPQSAMAVPRAGIVHRLDKDTSGLLLVAKTAIAHTALSRQLKARTIHRRYLALVEGHVPLDEGTIQAPLGRHLAHRKLMTVRHLGGRHAVTHYRVLHRLQTSDFRPQTSDLNPTSNFQLPTSNLRPPALLYSVVDVSLETGRTHQIRVHMAHLGSPVLGDTTYGRHPAGYWAARGIARQLLHAYTIRFAHPVTRVPMAFAIEPPTDVQAWLPGSIKDSADCKDRFR